MTFACAWLAAIFTFIALDILCLKLVIRPIFERHLGNMLRDDFVISVAVGFYALYAVGIVWFASFPAAEAGSWLLAFGNGAALGFLAYGTYEATNYATLKRWQPEMVMVDLAWGTTLTAICAVAGYAALTQVRA